MNFDHLGRGQIQFLAFLDELIDLGICLKGMADKGISLNLPDWNIFQNFNLIGILNLGKPAGLKIVTIYGKGKNRIYEPLLIVERY